MKPVNNYFAKTLLALIIATISFFIFKEFLPKKLFPTPKGVSKNVVIDSLLLEAVASADTVQVDTISVQKIVFQPQNGIVFPSETFDEYNGYQYMLDFYEKLYQLETDKNKKVRIAYFSDSMTDGDMIVQDLRTFFQDKFGGEGVGFVNITSESASSRSSVKHEFSNNWITQSYLKIKQPKNPFGVNGHVFYANDTINNAWVYYKASKMRHISHLPQPTLFYGYAENNNGKVFKIMGNDTIEMALQPYKKVNQLKLGESANALKLYFKGTASIPIYGFNFDDGKGVHVDNFSSRGNSGLPLSMFNVATMKEFQEKLGYDLIILHYGTNVLNYGTLNYSWYENRMNKVVAHLKQCFPTTEILVISTADKATKYDLEMKTDSAVVPLVTAQKKYAIASQTGFINLYEKMGGENSMIKWVEETPAKANKDYTHFNYRGSKEVGKLIFDQIEAGFQHYKKLRKKKTIVVKKKPDSIVKKGDSIYAN